MAKFNKFIEEVRKIRGLKSISVEYNMRYDSIFIKFDNAQWTKIDNENSTTWKKFRELLDKYDYSHEFYHQQIEVFEE